MAWGLTGTKETYVCPKCGCRTEVWQNNDEKPLCPMCNTEMEKPLKWNSRRY